MDDAISPKECKAILRMIEMSVNLMHLEEIATDRKIYCDETIFLRTENLVNDTCQDYLAHNKIACMRK